MFSLFFQMVVGGPNVQADDATNAKDPDPLFTWPSILNQRCDALATQALAEATDPQPAVPFLPACRATLSIDGVTITHHIPTQIRTAAGLPALRAYLARCHT